MKYDVQFTTQFKKDLKLIEDGVYKEELYCDL